MNYDPQSILDLYKAHIEKASDDKKTFVPPDAVANAARRALEAREKYGDAVRGGTSIGWTRANQLANKENISYDTIKRMHSFFSRHAGNEKVEAGKEWYQDAGKIAWEIWGGDPGKRWAESIIKQMEKKEINKAAGHKSICVDFDGVLNSYKSGWKGASVIPDEPVPGAFKWLYDLISNGFTVYIYSSRSNQSGGIEGMKRWFKKWDEEYRESKKDAPKTELLSRLNFPKNKPPASVYVDDNGLRFSGRFPSIEKLSSLKSWVKD